LTLKEKGLLFVEQPLSESERLPLGAEEGNLLEHLSSILAIVKEVIERQGARTSYMKTQGVSPGKKRKNGRKL
jgi:hypothetical protein